MVFGTRLSIKIYQLYREQTLEVIRSNPYQLIENVEGIGFGRADEVGRAFGIHGNHPDRIRAGCLYTLEHVSLQEGHAYMTAEQLIEQTNKLLNARESAVSDEDILACLAKLSEEEKGCC
ncbi:hypothetical protein GCM10020331_036070 [Ectobacillus funiculus]